MLFKVLMIICLFISYSSAQEVLDITVKGISDAQKDGAQKDRQEALMNAKRQACEKAGVQLKSQTKIENFQISFDYIESQAEAVLLPGFQVMDIGYVADGTYQVVLSGKIKVIEDDKINAKELRFAKSLYDKGKHSESRAILEKYIDEDAPAADETIREEALYLYIKWGYSFNTEADCDKFAAYFPESPHFAKMAQFGAFTKNALLKFNKNIVVNDDQWQDSTYKSAKNTFVKTLSAFNESVSFMDFSGQTITISVEYDLFSKDDDDEKVPAAYRLKIADNDGSESKIIEERFKELPQNKANTFQHSASGTFFKFFSLKNFQLKGDIPVGKDAYSYNLTFDIYQKGF